MWREHLRENKVINSRVKCCSRWRPRMDPCIEWHRGHSIVTLIRVASVEWWHQSVLEWALGNVDKGEKKKPKKYCFFFFEVLIRKRNGKQCLEMGFKMWEATVYMYANRNGPIEGNNVLMQERRVARASLWVGEAVGSSPELSKLQPGGHFWSTTCFYTFMGTHCVYGCFL